MMTSIVNSIKDNKKVKIIIISGIVIVIVLGCLFVLNDYILSKEIVNEAIFYFDSIPQNQEKIIEGAKFFIKK